MKPAVIYAAKSTADPRGSIPTQLAQLREAAEAAGHSVVGAFSDEAASAYHGNRGPELEKAMALAEQLAAEHGVCHFGVQHSDRLARGDGKHAKHLLHYGLWALQADVKIASLQDPQTFGDLLYTAVTGQRNHEDSARKSQSVTDGHARRRAKGGYHGGPEPYGLAYPRDEHGRTLPDQPLRRHELRGPVVARMFALVQDGLGQNAIAQLLNREGVPTGQKGKRWHGGTVGRIVSNPIYAGRSKTGEQLGHEGIVKWDTFQDVQGILATRKRGSAKGGRPSPALFTHGHLRCGRCGATMGYRAKPNAGGSTWERYVCTEREHDQASCTQRPVPVAPLEAAVEHELKRRAESRTKSEEAWRITHDADLAHVEKLATEAQREVVRTREGMARAEADYLAGDLSAKRYEPMAERLEEELAATEAQAQQIAARAEAMRLQASPEVADRYSEALLGIDALSLDAKRELLRSLFPVLTLRTEDGAMRVDLGQPAPDFIATLVDDELAGREGEPVLERQAATATESLGLTSAPVVAPIVVEGL